jgi:Domain of unknown function (DUF4389)
VEATLTSEAAPRHPIRLVVDDDLVRSRLTVFFRLLLAIPHLIWLTLVTIAVFFAVIASWFATLVAGQTPRELHRFIGWGLRYSTQVSAYVYLLANPFPSFTALPYPIDLAVDPPRPQSRWKTGFRLLLGLPALVIASVVSQLLQLLAFFGWFVCLVRGRMPEGMRNAGAFCLKYQQQTHGYLGLLTDRYPSLSFPKPDDS